MELNDARVLITGATGSLGGLIAEQLSTHGARLAVSGRDAQKLDSLHHQFSAHTIVADLGERAAPEHVVTTAADALGGLDIVIHAAGVVAFGDVNELSDETLDELIAVNLIAPMRLVRAAAKRLDGGGVIVVLSAIVADMPTAGMAAYSASKAGITAFNRAAARELRRRSIRLVDVRPPHTATGLEHRAIAGTPPKLPSGRPTDEVVSAIIGAITDDSIRDLPFT